MEIALVSKGYLIETYEWEKNDYAGIDLNGFIEEYQITKESISQIDVEGLFLQYKSNPDNVYSEDALFYEYLCLREQSDEKLKEEDLDQIKVIAFYSHEELGKYGSIIVDYELGEIYYGYKKDLLDNGETPVWTRPLSQKKKRILREMWDECNILSWERNNSESDIANSDAYSYPWKLLIELESGEIKTYRGVNHWDMYPEGYDVFLDTIEQGNVRLVTVEDLIDELDVPEKEYENMDLEAFIREEVITYDNIEGKELDEIFYKYKYGPDAWLDVYTYNLFNY